MKRRSVRGRAFSIGSGNNNGLVESGVERFTKGLRRWGIIRSIMLFAD